MQGYRFIRWFEEITIQDLPLVGGKNASLGEMIRGLLPKGIKIPPGFAVTADAFTTLVSQNTLSERIHSLLSSLDAKNTAQLSRIGSEIRSAVRGVGLPPEVSNEIKSAYRKLCECSGLTSMDVAVRSSATAEDLPDASFAGQQETFLNVRGEDDLLEAWLNCFASLYTDRAISYRATKGFEHPKVRLSDGFSIGSNDLTQLTLGVDRDSSQLSHLFDERDPAMQRMLAMVVEKVKKTGKPIGICGQAPSDYPEITGQLVGLGIDSISLSPDSIFQMIEVVAAAERKAPS